MFSSVTNAIYLLFQIILVVNHIHLKKFCNNQGMIILVHTQNFPKN